MQDRQAFDAELDALTAQVMAMGGLAESQLGQALHALVHASGETASHVLERERRLDAEEVQVERLLWSLVARRQPTARDLRRLIATARLVRDLERAGDEAARIARSTHRLLRHGAAGALRGVMAGLAELGRHAGAQLHAALDAFARGDAAAARAVIRDDAAVDAGFDELLRLLAARMADDPRQVRAGIELVFAAKALERIGDHAKNIAEQAVYAVEGADLRVQPPAGAAAPATAPAAAPSAASSARAPAAAPSAPVPSAPPDPRAP